MKTKLLYLITIVITAYILLSTSCVAKSISQGNNDIYIIHLDTTTTYDIANYTEMVKVTEKHIYCSDYPKIKNELSDSFYVVIDDRRLLLSHREYEKIMSLNRK